MVKKIVAATGAVLVMQRGYTETFVREWSAEGRGPCRETRATSYYLTLVVPDSDPRRMPEWHNDVRRLERPGLEISALICGQKAAMREVKRAGGHFPAVYRLGLPLYNGAPDLFSQAGAGCRHPTTQKHLPGKPAQKERRLRF